METVLMAKFESFFDGMTEADRKGLMEAVQTLAISAQLNEMTPHQASAAGLMLSAVLHMHYGCGHPSCLAKNARHACVLAAQLGKDHAVEHGVGVH
jgi:hypothetical protein